MPHASASLAQLDGAEQSRWTIFATSSGADSWGCVLGWSQPWQNRLGGPQVLCESRRHSNLPRSLQWCQACQKPVVEPMLPMTFKKKMSPRRTNAAVSPWKSPSPYYVAPFLLTNQLTYAQTWREVLRSSSESLPLHSPPKSTRKCSDPSHPNPRLTQGPLGRWWHMLLWQVQKRHHGKTAWLFCRSCGEGAEYDSAKHAGVQWLWQSTGVRVPSERRDWRSDLLLHETPIPEKAWLPSSPEALPSSTQESQRKDICIGCI